MLYGTNSPFFLEDDTVNTAILLHDLGTREAFGWPSHDPEERITQQLNGGARCFLKWAILDRLNN